MAKRTSDIYKRAKMGVCTARLQKCGCVAIQPGERMNGMPKGNAMFLFHKSKIQPSERAAFIIYVSLIKENNYV